MRIGIMLRHLGQHGGGVVVYTENLLREMFALATEHEFLLMYRDPSFLGTFSDGRRLRETVLSAPSIPLWDQVAVPRAARRESLDVVFNPKYSIPLFTSSRTAFVCHGLDWYVSPQWSRWQDRLNHRLLFPRYVRAADGIIAVSETARQDLIRFLGVEATRITTVHHGVDEIFRKEPGSDDLARVKRRYGLPDRYLLYCGQIYPPKNFGRLIRSFADVGPSLDLSLVVAGSRTWLSKNEVDEVERLGLEHRVLRLGWVPRQDLPALYSLAEALVMPSLYESFGLPLLEAMCAGCPVLTSNRRGPREVVDDAAVLVEPEDLDSISEGMRRVVEDGKLRDDLISRGRRRAATFSWKRCASQTLQALENLEQGA